MLEKLMKKITIVDVAKKEQYLPLLMEKIP